MTFIDRSGRTSTEYRQLFWDERERCEELEAELKRMKGINQENGDHAAALQTQLDNHRKQTEHWLTLLDKAEAQLEAVRKLPDEWVHSGNGHYYGSDCAEQLQAILNKAAIGEDES